MVDGKQNVLVSMNGGSGATLDVMSYLVPLALVLGVWYLLVFQPQRTEQNTREQMLASLGKGDEIVTSSGIFGTIVDVSADVLTVELGERTKIRLERSAVARKVSPPAPKK